MNLKNCGGRVPIRNITANSNTPYLLVDFPTKEVFYSLYSRYVPKANQDKYWDILNKRREGATLEQSARPYALSRQRVREIEAKFIRLVGRLYWRELEQSLSALSKPSSRLETL